MVINIMASDERDYTPHKPRKTEYKARVRRVLKSKKAQAVAAKMAKDLKRVCRAIVKKGGAASGF